MITEVLYTIEELTSTCHTNSFNNIGNKTTKRLLGDNTIEETYLGRDNLVDDNTTNRGLNHSLLYFTIYKVVNNNLYLSMKVTLLLIVSYDCFF